ncbi:hypothetical protein PVK06_040594 [Gossypium arboreum]|uniref:RNase H type-1 domain-containing protein n=1 Tax=Gossypium arboreum TaxID=29729 RepID=A0ABR0N820_GOSAR|nr:hypothetical protein PVK06_040594 [Gossypium arboreum]
MNKRKLRNTQQHIKWSVPEKPIVKINFNASFDNKTHQSAYVIVARNHNGEIIIAGSYLHTTVAKAFEAKAIAYYEVVLLWKDMGLSDIMIEGDSKSTIIKCMIKSRDKS